MPSSNRWRARFGGGGGSSDARLTCPKCKAEIPIAESEVRPGHKVRCRSCGTEHELAGPDIERAIAEHEARLKNLLGQK
ncbi:MAG: hypothetical protein IPM35_20320 [Myxococcales bacterium]|nr:hypothetical protein [Myxococcales bacterium]